MIADRNSEDYQPLTWVGRYPVYLSTLFAGVLAITMAITAVASGTGAGLYSLYFDSGEVVRNFGFWRLFTYSLVNAPNFWFALNIVMFAFFGREVEKYLGRRTFFWIFMALIVVPTVGLTVAALFGWQTGLVGGSGAMFGIFVAFAALYPSAEIFFGLQASWIAIALFAVGALQCFGGRLWPQLFVLTVDSATALLAVHYVRGGMEFVSQWFESRKTAKRRAAFRIVKSAPEPVEVHESIDPILEKISRHGISSLTRSERERLQKAREALIEREREH